MAIIAISNQKVHRSTASLGHSNYFFNAKVAKSAKLFKIKELSFALLAFLRVKMKIKNYHNLNCLPETLRRPTASQRES